MFRLFSLLRLFRNCPNVEICVTKFVQIVQIIQQTSHWLFNGLIHLQNFECWDYKKKKNALYTVLFFILLLSLFFNLKCFVFFCLKYITPHYKFILIYIKKPPLSVFVYMINQSSHVYFFYCHFIKVKTWQNKSTKSFR